jgi:hypothetical protein
MTKLGRAALVAVALATPLAADAQESRLQHFRPYDRGGIGMFEAPKEDTTSFQGVKIHWGASFAQQFQALDHENTAAPRVVNDVNQNQLIELGTGFNLATANLYLGAQLADGIRVHLTTYLSSRHHPEAWVKDGYILVDAVPMLDSESLDRLMEYVTLRVGHFEINYGDAHFRRTDNGNAMYNPFVGNYLLDAFTTEIGGEVYVRTSGGFLAMAAITGGEIQGSVVRPDDRAPSFYGKIGFDRQFDENLRVRLTGSAYTTSKSLNNTLYGGDRAGSRYYFVMENTGASVAANFTSGRLNPGFRSKVTALMLNPFVKVGGLELFGIVERSEGRAANEAETRTWSHYMGEALFRLGAEEDFYLGGRYGTASGPLTVGGPEVGADRFQLGGGWFVTPNILMKAEYVNQQYNDFLPTDIRNGGKFSGIMFEGVISF